MNVNTMNSLLVLVVLVLLTCGQQHLANAMQRGERETQMGKCKVKDFRLLDYIKPTAYKLHLEVNPFEDTFSGSVEIRVNFYQTPGNMNTSRHSSNELRTILLNIQDLDVTDVNFHHYRKPLKVNSFCHDADNQILKVTLEEDPLFNRYAIITLKFNGRVQTEAKGLFRNGVGAVVTHFKPNSARRVFPCFDEPRFRATFEVEIEHPLRVTALSNMGRKKRRAGGELNKSFFEATPPMPIYLLSIAVGQFDVIQKTNQEGIIPISLYFPASYTQAALEHMLDKAYQVYQRVSMFFEGANQPLKKIDIMAVDMPISAMESWGLITMKWQLLCTPMELMKPEEKNHAVTVLTNMLVRFWLGNLISVGSWEDLWFIEGLSNYVTSELTREMFPEFSSELYMLLGTTYSAMKDDDHPQTAHTIQPQSPRTLNDIETLCDSSSYRKSEALFRMFAYFMGKDKFNLAIQKFVIRMDNFRGLIMIDLFWEELSAFISARNNRMLNNVSQWTQQTGYPIIFVSLTEQHRLRVRQRSNLGDGKFWPVPITYEINHVTEGSVYKEPFVLADSRVKEISLPRWFNPHSSEHWLKFNPRYEGYYRVVYESPELGDLLGVAVNNGLMPPVDRLQLLSDSYTQIKQAGYMVDFVTLLKNYPKETDPGVMLLWTKLLIDMYESGWQNLARSNEIKSMMMNYYELTGRLSAGADSSVLEECARGHVLYYLVFILEDDDIIEEVWKYKMMNNPLPPFFQNVDQYLPD